MAIHALRQTLRRLRSVLRARVQALSTLPARPMLDHPGQLNGREWQAVIVRTVRAAPADHYGMVASSIAFFSFLALLPSLAAIALAYGIVTEPAVVVKNIRSLIQIVPGDARNVVGRWLVETITRPDGRDVGLAVSVGLALYSATRAARSIVLGLNIATGTAVRRPLLARLLVSFLIVIAGASLILGSLFALSALAFLERLFPYDAAGTIPVLRIAFWSLATVGAGLALSLVYRHAPAREPPQWRWVLPGALATTLMWLLATTAFGFYLGSFGSYDRTHGSLGAAIVLQIWLFLSAFILIIGAKLNAEIMRCAGMAQPTGR